MQNSHDPLLSEVLALLAKLPYGDHRSTTWLAQHFRTQNTRITDLICFDAELWKLVRAKRCVSVSPTRKPRWFNLLSDSEQANWPKESLREEQKRLPTRTALTARAAASPAIAYIQRGLNFLRHNTRSLGALDAIGQVEAKLSDVLGDQIETNNVKTLEIAALRSKLAAAERRNGKLTEALAALGRSVTPVTTESNVVAFAGAD